jgi:indolepyruvate ferredoxin oxidoreductase
MLRNGSTQTDTRRRSDQSSSPLFDFSLDDKYLREEGIVLLTGIQALVRLPLDQHRADRRAGLKTATLISGYRGSPLGGLDLLLAQTQEILKQHEVVFIPGVNEELGATAVFGSQIANLMPAPKYDGVLGMWYGKAPGVDRSTDAFKHANFAGVGRYGGVLAIAGDDPISKSSTLPSHSEIALYDALCPVLFPGNVQEILDLGRLGFELSRYSGLWAGFKFVTNVADGFDTAEVAPDRMTVTTPEFTYNGKPWQHTQSTRLLTPFSLEMEQEIYEGRLEAAQHFVSANQINSITVPTSDAWLGIVAAGKTYYDMRQALSELDLDEDGLRKYGIRLLKISVLFPLEANIIHEFAEGLEEILILEEKRPFIEPFIRDMLYHKTERPRVVGKRDEWNNPLVPPHGQLSADRLIPILAKRIAQRISLDTINARLEALQQPSDNGVIPLLARTPYYCSGCPHNSSTVTPEGSLVGGGIGCHTMTLLIPGRDVTGITQMGGEGAQWVGASPFSDVPHIFQNLGDGTLFHSGSLAIRQAIAAGVNITYKILYNSAVAMTGGQTADGEMSVPALVTALRAEGAGRIIITTDDPGSYSGGMRWPEGVEVWHRDRLDEAQRVLREEPGVTILIHDQECAAELRRKRRRKLVPDPAVRVFINEAVCEGCGDCGEKSNCLSVFPVDTEFGRKTQIHQASCNRDYSCLKGHCPAFVTAIPGEVERKTVDFEVDIELPEPEYKVEHECNLFMMGIGGTGVVTTNQVLATAALIDGKYVRGLDQTGLSQKGGPVVSSLKILSDNRLQPSTKISAASADCYIVFDLLTATDADNLSRAHPDRTVAVISTSQVPTGSMVRSTEVSYPQQNHLLDAINRVTRAEENIVFDAVMLSEILFGSHMPANILVLGAAYQQGLIPVRAEAIERAIELNGVAVKMNRAAFQAGRRAVIDPDWRNSLTQRRMGDLPIQPEITPEMRQLIDSVDADGELLRLLEIRVAELVDYQNINHAKEYVEFVRHVRTEEQQRTPGSTKLSEAVARYLFKLMAYKDEYEVARLYLRPEFKQVFAEQFGADADMRYMLQPPLLRGFGLQRKVRLGRWFDRMYRLLLRLRFLRGTPLDVFGYDEVRRVEQRLPGQYRQLIEQALHGLSPENYDRAVTLAKLPDVIRGYDHIKLRNVDRFWAEVKQLGFRADEV